MKFSTRELDKYLPMTTGYKLDHICVMLEKIVDGIGHPQVILAGDLIDQPLWTEEHTRLYEENARLRDDLKKSEKRNVQLMEIKQAAQNEINRLGEQLRWHSVDELPKKETTNCSITVLLDIDYVGVLKVYYNFLSEIWVGVQGKQEYFRAEDFKNTKARWCYIPDDNQGTDCTPDDGDA